MKFCSGIIYEYICFRYFFYIFITDNFGEIQAFRKEHTVLIKYHHLIRAMGSYAVDLNLVQ
jgi:hypothetical protein